MEEYKPNSHRPKEPPEQKKVEAVVTGNVTKQKKNEIQKFADVFIAEDASSVKSYIFMEVLVPAVKKAISDIVTNGIDMILYGESGRRRSQTSGSKVSYAKCYDRENDRRRDYSAVSRSGFGYDALLYDTRGDAEAVLDDMNNIISQYQVVSVADLYDLSNVTCENYNANKYGWTDIRGCKAVRVKDGYVLRGLPKPMPIN